ncbi:MAG: sigma-54-dependent transcriptional regulator [Planctomycetota bacterium]
MDDPSPTTGERILLVDDDPIILDSLGAFLREEGYEVVAVETVAAAVQALSGDRFELVISDVSMPRAGGLDLLRYVRKNHGDVVMILITGYGTIESAVEAIKLGAYDYLTKPVIDDDVRWCVRRACQQQKLIAENRRLREQLEARYSFDSIIGGDHKMLKIFELITAVADSRSTILMTGESGTGKSLVARAIHAHSSRASGPFVEVACGSLPETLLESELFGHAAGAFTGAVGATEGKFAAADGGTIFLDEIATASPALQVKLLRVLQERRFEPVGSNETRTADVRVVLATNADLQAEVAAGRFREDLYYRVNVVNIALPPLRERPADIPLLARHFLTIYADEASKEIAGFDAEAIDCLQRYAWPGNVRELENCIERAVLLCRTGRIGRADLPETVAAVPDEPAPPIAANEDRPMSLTEALAAPEREIIQAALHRNGGNRAATAAELQINRTTLYKKMRKLGVL